jgi:hypothetical protein
MVPPTTQAPIDPPTEADDDEDNSNTENKKDAYYSNCAAAKAAGAAPLRRGVDGGYRKALDRDGDGIACD